MISVLLYVCGFAAVIAGWPVDGLPGAALALVGVVLIWAGWFRVVRRSRGGAR